MTRTPSARVVALLAVAFAATPAAAAAPTDDVLRVAPPDAALVLLVRDARGHADAVAGSPFAAWFPASALGKQLLAAGDVRRLREAAAPVLVALGVTPEELLNNVFGDAVAFAYTPAAPADPAGERALLLVRPRKPETLAKLIDRLNEIQTGNGEVKAVVRREHLGEPYFERQKAGGGAEFYAFRGPVFAYSGSEADVRAVVGRDKTAPPVADKAPELAAKMARLGVADALAVLLVNPRPFDAEFRAKTAAAKPDEEPFLRQFAEAWAALDAAALYVAVGADAEVGVALDFRPTALPQTARAWLTGDRPASALWPAVPADALVAVAARFRAADLLDTVRAVLPVRGKAALDASLADTLGPVVGRDRLPLVLDALGPDWALWLEPPVAGSGPLPAAVGVVRVKAAGPRAKETQRAMERAVGFGFQAARVAYNATHADQIELLETPDGDAVVTSLVGAKAFPPGVQPAFAFKAGYLVVASTSAAVERFRPPTGDAKGGEAVAARVSGPAIREYVRTHRDAIAEMLAAAGRGEKADVAKQFDQFAAVLEPVERMEILIRGSESGVRVAVRVKLVKPLK